MRTSTAVLLATLIVTPSRAAMQFEDVPPPSRPSQPSQPSQPTQPRKPPPPRPQQQPSPERPPGPPTNSADPNLLTDPRSRCAVWVPDPRPGETVQWTGRCSNGLANGPGEALRQADGQVRYLYQGTFEAGRLTGRATRIAANGERLEAEFREGRANGPGTLEYRDGVYEGEFRNDLPNGHGVRTWRDTRPWRRYEGQWANGVRSGTGRMDYGNGSTYEGGWRNDRRNGTGRMDYGNGSTYEGGWRNEQRDGQGTFRWNVNGVTGVYIGEWRNDQRNGTGSEIFTSQNARIDGSFAGDRPEGQVVYVSGTTRVEGEVRDGCLRTARNQTYRIMPGPGECR